MPSFADVITKKVDALRRRMDRSTGVFEVVDTSPFTVYLDGITSVEVEALAVPGLTYTVGMKGRYFLDQGQQPLCLPTTTAP